MKIVPVLDLMSRQVVRGIAGQRSQYRPIESQLARGSAPRDMAKALVQQFGFGEAYVADLDAIGGGQPDWESYRDLSGCGLRLWIDAGLSSVGDARRLCRRLDEEGIAFRLVAGLETLAGPEALAEILGDVGTSQVVFSLDLKQGVPLTSAAAWRDCSAADIAAAAQDCGVESMIVLDLANVGMRQGTSTHALTRTIRARQATIELIGGGGVRSIDDLRSLSSAGFDAALVASALHDARLMPNDLEQVQSW